MFSRTLSITTTAALLAASQAFGQSPVINVAPPQQNGSPVAADAVRAAGEAYANTGRGAIDIETARQAYIDNTKLAHAAAIEHRYLLEDRRNEINARERAVRGRRDAMLAQTPKQELSNQYYNRSTGRVKWPDVLQAAHFASERALLETLLEEKATSRDWHDDVLIVHVANDLSAKLKTDIRAVPPFAYLDGRKFLGLLVDEARADARETTMMVAEKNSDPRRDSNLVSR